MTEIIVSHMIRSCDSQFWNSKLNHLVYFKFFCIIFSAEFPLSKDELLEFQKTCSVVFYPTIIKHHTLPGLK